MRTIKLKKCPRIHRLQYSPGGDTLCVLGGAEAQMVDSTLLIDVATGGVVRRLDQLCTSAAVSPRLSRLVLAEADHFRGNLVGVLQWTDPRTDDGWEPIGNPPFRATPSRVTGVGLDATGSRLAVSMGWTHRRTADRGVFEWEYELWQYRFATEAWEMIDHSDRSLAGPIAFAPNAKRLVMSGGGEGLPVVRVLGVPKGTEVARFEPPGRRTHAVQWSPGGTVAVANHRTVYVLSPGVAEPRLTLSGHAGQVNAVAFSPDGSRLLSASHDGSIRVWDAHTGQQLQAFDWKVGPVTALAVAPDGLTCAAGGKGTIVIWDVDL